MDRLPSLTPLVALFVPGNPVPTRNKMDVSPLPTTCHVKDLNSHIETTLISQNGYKRGQGRSCESTVTLQGLSSPSLSQMTQSIQALDWQIYLHNTMDIRCSGLWLPFSLLGQPGAFEAFSSFFPQGLVIVGPILRTPPCTPCFTKARMKPIPKPFQTARPQIYTLSESESERALRGRGRTRRRGGPVPKPYLLEGPDS